MIKVVGSAIIENDEGKVLAFRLNKEIVGGVFVPLGGKLEDNETIRECVIREVKEELGIDIEIAGINGITEEKYADGFWVSILYGAKILKGTPKIMEPEKILEIKWIDRDKFKNSDAIHWLN